MKVTQVAAISSDGNQLILTVSKRLILLKLLFVGSFALFCLLVLAFILSSTQSTSLFGLILAQPLLLVLVLPTLLLLWFTFHLSCLLYSGQSFSFDQGLNSIHSNSRKVASLTDLTEVQIRRPTYPTPKDLRTLRGAFLETPAAVSEKLRPLPVENRLWEWPSVWLIFKNRRPLEVLNTTALMPFRLGFLPLIIHLASQQDVELSVVALATRVAEHARVALNEEIQVPEKRSGA